MPALLLLAFVMLLALCAGASAALDVLLTLREPIGVPRREEPITCGVPLPKGVCKNPSALRLFEARGAEVPASFAAANRWWEDGSVKWVHISLQRSLPAYGEETLHLRMAEPRKAASELQVQESPSDITVTTGPMRFRVRKQRFNLLDQVWLDESGTQQFDDAHAILADRPRGARVSQGSRTAWANAEADCAVMVGEANPFRVVIRAEGRHRLANGAPLTDFITRITAYRGKSYVTVSHVFLVRQGESMSDYLSLHDVSLVLPLSLEPDAEGLRYQFGGSERVHEGRMARQGGGLALSARPGRLRRLLRHQRALDRMAHGGKGTGERAYTAHGVGGCVRRPAEDDRGSAGLLADVPEGLGRQRERRRIGRAPSWHEVWPAAGHLPRHGAHARGAAVLPRGGGDERDLR